MRLANRFLNSDRGSIVLTRDLHSTLALNPSTSHSITCFLLSRPHKGTSSRHFLLVTTKDVYFPIGWARSTIKMIYIVRIFTSSLALLVVAVMAKEHPDTQVVIIPIVETLGFLPAVTLKIDICIVQHV